MPGDRVRVRKMGNGVLIEPVAFDTKAWFAKLDKFRSVPFMPEGRNQPNAQKRRFFD
jgi:antitoxin VapB